MRFARAENCKICHINVANPYWDWDNPAHPSVPDAWPTPQDSSNPLWDANRSAVSGSQLPNSLVGSEIMNPIVGASTFARFGGTSGSAGNLENGPHGGVHIWCGDTSLQSAGADMGLLDTAAQDPLFWAHHAAIDRLWSVWLGASHKNPTSSPWLKHKFTFWDEMKRWVSIIVADVINISNNLRYTYGMVAAPEVTGNPVVTELTVDSGGAIRLPAAMTNTLLGSQGNRSKTTTLRLARVMLPPGAAGIYRIVVNTPPAVAAADVAATANDLGHVAIVPKTSKDGQTHRHPDLTVDLDVTGQLPKPLEQNGN